MELNLSVTAQFIDTIIMRKTDSVVDVFIPVLCRVGFYVGRLFSTGETGINSIRIPIEPIKGILGLHLKKRNYLVAATTLQAFHLLLYR